LLIYYSEFNDDFLIDMVQDAAFAVGAEDSLNKVNFIIKELLLHD
jgi:hypothetical protein